MTRYDPLSTRTAMGVRRDDDGDDDGVFLASCFSEDVIDATFFLDRILVG